MDSSEQRKFIFLCGLHRSGTSPLFRALREHPQISGFTNTGVPEDEGQHLQTVYPAANVYGGPGLFGFAPEAHITERSSLVNRLNRKRLFEEWSRYWDLRKPYLLEKSPPNLIRTRFLQALFPNSYFVVIYRHPIAVSLATQKWTNLRLAVLFDHWLRCHELFERDRARLHRVLIVRYEDLVQDSSGKLAEIRNFLELGGPLSSSFDPSINNRYFEAWSNLGTDHKTGVAFDRLLEKYERKTREFGYSLLHPDVAIPTLRRSQAV